MLTTRSSLILAAYLLCCACLNLRASQKSETSQQLPPCKWTGTISATKNLFGTQTITGTVTFEFDRNTAAGIEYKLTGGHVSWSASGSFGKCEVSGGPVEFDLSSDSGDTGNLIIYTDGGYNGGGSFGRLNTTDPLVTVTCTSSVFQLPPDLYEFIITSNRDTTIVDDVVSGSYDTTYAPGLSIFYTWNLNLTGADTKLSVGSDEYDNWLPTAGKKETDIGQPISIQAKLIRADGTIACERAESFKFELIEVSKEKGVALNFPDAGSAQGDPDLHFVEEFLSETDILSPDRLTLTAEAGREALVFIPSFDWGAYAKLKVTAKMRDGTLIVGFLEGHPEITEIPLPKRTNNSKIADKWKKDKGVESLNDDDDEESEPKGDLDAGDGFTLYEEYRGFFENGKHIFGDPKRKDLFVYKQLDAFIPGIQLFARLTKLRVRYQFTKDEFDPTKRIMNFNHTDAPHQTDQHCLRIAMGRTSSTRLGPPKHSDTVSISRGAFVHTTLVRGHRKEITNELNSTVAHELGHGSHVLHHGETDLKKNTYTYTYAFNFTTSSFDLEITENNLLIIDPRWENGKPYMQPITGQQYIGVWGGQHSGYDDCIMRYDCAFGYIPGTGGNIRYITNGNERTGIMLCEKKEDNPGGLNHLNRQPRPRYGTADEGKCKSQLCVSDKYH